MRISDWSSDVCSSDLVALALGLVRCFGRGVDFAAGPAAHGYRLLPAGSVGSPWLVGLLPGGLGDRAGIYLAGGRGCGNRGGLPHGAQSRACRSEEHTSELQSLMRISYAVFCLKKNKKYKSTT